MKTYTVHALCDLPSLCCSSELGPHRSKQIPTSNTRAINVFDIIPTGIRHPFPRITTLFLPRLPVEQARKHRIAAQYSQCPPRTVAQPDWPAPPPSRARQLRPVCLPSRSMLDLPRGSHRDATTPSPRPRCLPLRPQPRRRSNLLTMRCTQARLTRPWDSRRRL